MNLIMLEPPTPESVCPINKLMDVISAKWTVEIIRELALQPTRTRRFLLHIPGLSMKTLCRRLHALEAAGLINRYEYPGKPAKVEYSLNDYGRKLCKVFEQIKLLQEELNGACQSCTCPMTTETPSEDAVCPERRTRRTV